MPFRNPPTDLRLPDDETTVQFIFLDGDTGEITIVGTSGSKIVISPNEINPSIRFYSPDGTNDAFINAVNFGIPTVSDLGVNSGRWTPPDGTERRGRLYLNTNTGGGLGAMQFGVIKALTQVLFGGFVQPQANGLFLGYRDDDASILGEISAVRSGSTVDMQIKSGPYTPADALQRIARILMQPGSDFHAFSVIKTSNNAVKGGLAQIAYDRGLFGYRDADGAIYNRMAAVSNALQLIAENGPIQFFTTNNDVIANANNLVVNGGLQTTGDFRIGTRSQGRGLAGYISSIVNSAAVGAEAVVLTTPTITFVNDRCYEVEWVGNAFPSVANNFMFVRVRQTNVAGALKAFAQYSLPAASGQQYCYGKFHIRRTAGTDLATTLALTSQAVAGTVTWTGATTDVRYLKVSDCGAAADYPNAITI